MTTPTDIIRRFYDDLRQGDAAGALALMADDIEWTTMWRYRADGRGPGAVAAGVLAPLMAEWLDPLLAPEAFIAEGGVVVSLGRFTAVHAATGRPVEARYAHVWTVEAGRIASFRQYIDTLAVALAEAGRP